MMATAPEQPKIWYKEVNPESTKGTILFVHGLFTSDVEFRDVSCSLAEYHLILTHLPGHSNSKDVPFTLDNAIEAIHNIVLEKGLVGKAHIVGMSLGGQVALQFARRYPGAATSIFASGAVPLRGWARWFTERPSLVHYMNWPVMRSPDVVYRQLCRLSGIPRHDDLRAIVNANYDFDLLSASTKVLLSTSVDDYTSIEGTRIALVAGGKQDDFENAQLLARILREKDEGSRAFVVRKAAHAWDIQFPTLFAEGVRAWVEGGEMPEEYEELV